MGDAVVVRLTAPSGAGSPARSHKERKVDPHATTVVRVRQFAFDSPRILVGRLRSIRAGRPHAPSSARVWRPTFASVTGGAGRLRGLHVRIRKRSCAARRVDLVAFGRAYIATPDPVERFAAGAPLAMPSRETFYTGNARGYVDYPRAGRPGTRRIRPTPSSHGSGTPRPAPGRASTRRTERSGTWPLSPAQAGSRPGSAFGAPGFPSRDGWHWRSPEPCRPPPSLRRPSRPAD